MARRRWCAILLGAVLGVFSAPALSAQAATPAPHLDTYTVNIIQPTAPDPDHIVGCTNQVFNCGYVSVAATFSNLEMLSTGSSTNDGNLQGTARLTRVYGCQTPSGRRLHRYDRRVVETAVFNTRNGFGFRLEPGQQTLNVVTYDFLSDAQPGNCPSWTQATQYSMKVDRLELNLIDFGVDPVAQYDYRVRGTWIWRGAVATIPLSLTAAH
jgi:hypothetical protein